MIHSIMHNTVGTWTTIEDDKRKHRVPIGEGCAEVHDDPNKVKTPFIEVNQGDCERCPLKCPVRLNSFVSQEAKA